MRKILIYLAFTILPFLLLSTVQSEEITVIGYNVESGGADPDVVSQRLAEIDGCDIWG